MMFTDQTSSGGLTFPGTPSAMEETTGVDRKSAGQLKLELMLKLDTFPHLALQRECNFKGLDRFGTTDELRNRLAEDQENPNSTGDQLGRFSLLTRYADLDGKGVINELSARLIRPRGDNPNDHRQQLINDAHVKTQKLIALIQDVKRTSAGAQFNAHSVEILSLEYTDKIHKAQHRLGMGLKNNTDMATLYANVCSEIRSARNAFEQGVANMGLTLDLGKYLIKFSPASPQNKDVQFTLPMRLASGTAPSDLQDVAVHDPSHDIEITSPTNEQATEEEENLLEEEDTEDDELLEAESMEMIRPVDHHWYLVDRQFYLAGELSRPYIQITKERIPVAGSMISSIQKAIHTFEPLGVFADHTGYYLRWPDTPSGFKNFHKCHKFLDNTTFKDNKMGMKAFAAFTAKERLERQG